MKLGYMRELLPDTAPEEPEDWETIFKDVEKVIMPGVSSYFQTLSYQKSETMSLKQGLSPLLPQVVHWQSPHMHAYYPSLTSWPSMLGDMLADAINCVGFTWVRQQLTFYTTSKQLRKHNYIHVFQWVCMVIIYSIWIDIVIHNEVS